MYVLRMYIYVLCEEIGLIRVNKIYPWMETNQRLGFFYITIMKNVYLFGQMGKK